MADTAKTTKAAAEPAVLPTIGQALSAVMSEVIAVSKASRNTNQNFNFRGIDAVMNAVGPAFRAHGVVTLPHVIDYTAEVVATKNGGSMNHYLLRVQYEFVGPAGDSLLCEVYGESSDSGDKGMSKAHSVAYRTALLQVLTIPTDEQDPDASNYERASKAEAPATQPANLATDKQVTLIFALAKDLGWTDKYLLDTIKRSVKKEHPGDLTKSEASKMIDYLTGKVNEQKAADKAEDAPEPVDDDAGRGNEPADIGEDEIPF